MFEMVVHNGTRYRPEDAKRLGIKAEAEPIEDKAERKPAENKAARPAGRKTTGGGRRGKSGNPASAG